MLYLLGLNQVVISPTRDDNLLDIWTTDTAVSLSDVQIDDAGCISDNRLKHVNLAFGVPTIRVSTSTFRSIKKIVPASFGTVLRHSVLFASPATTVDALTDQMVDVITDELDKIAPLKRYARRPSKPITKWLSDEAITAQRESRRFERKWKSTRSESDRVNNRRAVAAQTESSKSHDVYTSTDGSVTATTRDNNEESQMNSFTPMTTT